MTDELIEAVTPTNSKKEGERNIMIIVNVAIVIGVIAMTVLFLYVNSVNNHMDTLGTKVHELSVSIDSAKADVQRGTDLNNQGRAAVCELAATRFTDLSNLPKVCFTPDVIKWYDPKVAQILSAQRDGAAFKQSLCLVLPNNPACTHTGP